MKPRIPNPGKLVPGAVDAIMALHAASQKGGVPPAILTLSHLRASQINGCSFCVDYGVRYARKAGESDDRLFAVAAWRDSPLFTDAERAALSLTEAVTRLADRSDPVPDAIWTEAARYFDEKALAALVLNISTTNVMNRVNVTTRQVAGSWG